MFAYDSNPFFDEQRNLQAQAWMDARYENAIEQLASWGLDPEDFDDPLDAYEEMMADDEAYRMEEEMLA